MQSLGGILRWCLGIGEFIVCDARVTRIRCRRCLAKDLCEEETAELKIISVAKRGHTHLRERTRLCGRGNGRFSGCPWGPFLCRQAHL